MLSDFGIERCEEQSLYLLGLFSAECKEYLFSEQIMYIL